MSRLVLAEKERYLSVLTEWIKRHQVAAFFIIAFGITWGLGFSYGAVLKRGQYWLAPLAAVATCGPALAGIIISAVSNTQPRRGTRKAFWVAFFVAWLVSALVSLAHRAFINHAPISSLLIGFTFVFVVPVAFVISTAYSRVPAVSEHLSSLIRLRGVLTWSCLAVVLIPALTLLSVTISSILGRQQMAARQFPDIGLTLIGLVTVKFLYQLLFFNATGEEVGWRGFALPRLQTRSSPMIAALILAAFWSPWHLFLWQAEGKPVLNLQYWIEMYILHIPATLLIVWLFNRSGGSILVAGIIHAAANTTFAFFPKLDFQVYNVIISVVVLVIIVADRMWKKLPTDHPAVYRSPEPTAQQLAAAEPAGVGKGGV